MAVSDYSTTPSANTSISGINIAEDCPSANVNNAIRQMMADIKSFSLTVPDASLLMPKSGGVFTGGIYQNGAGGYLVHQSSGNLSGLVIVQASGGGTPAGMANGDILLEY